MGAVVMYMMIKMRCACGCCRDVWSAVRVGAVLVIRRCAWELHVGAVLVLPRSRCALVLPLV